MKNKTILNFILTFVVCPYVIHKNIYKLRQ